MKRLAIAILLFAVSFAGSLPSLKYRALDNNGDPISGAKLYFYGAGTTTQQATYPTEADEIAETNANANPVVADSNGWFGEIFLQTDQDYKVVMKSADDATTYFTVDNIDATQLSNADLATRLAQAATNPLDQGAVGDGAADESTEVQAAIDAATGVVDLLGKTYRCDSALVFDTGQNGVVVKNGTLDFSNANVNFDVTAYGTLGATNSLTSGASVGALTIALTTVTGLKADDWLLLGSTDTFASSVYRGEVVQIESIAALVATLKSPIEADYTTSGSVRLITPVERLRFENVHFISNPSSSGTGVSFRSQMVNDLSFDHCRFENFKTRGVSLDTTGTNITIENSEFVSSSATAIALYTSGAIQDVRFLNNTVSGILDGASLGPSSAYQTRRVLIHGNLFTGVTQGVIAGVSTQYINIIANEFIGNTAGASGTGDAIEILAPDFRIINNTIREPGGNGILVDTDAMTYSSGKDLTGVISGNRIWEADDAGIDVQAATSPALSDLMVSNNQIWACGADGIYVDMAGPIVTANKITDAGGDGIYVDITSGSIDGVVVANNVVINPSDHGIFVSAGAGAITVSRVAITGNAVSDVDTANEVPLYIGADTGAYITYITVTGNTFERDDDLDYNIQLEGGQAAGVDHITISGNTLVNGSYAIGEDTDANNTNVHIEANLVDGMSTGIIYGTAIDMFFIGDVAGACSTQCGSRQCYFGYDDNGGAGNLVDCADASADHCVCGALY